MDGTLNETGEDVRHTFYQNDVFSSAIGIIYPPPEVKAIIDKTAMFVARNGIEFEDKIRTNEANNTKFNFMNPNDPYYSYYRYKLKVDTEGDIKIDNKISIVPSNIISSEKTNENDIVDTNINKLSESNRMTTGIVNYYKILMDESQPNFQKIVEVPKYTEEEIQNMILPKPYEFLIGHPNILLMDIDIMKITAQFVAKGGRLFLNNLMQREQRNYFFDFLKPQHSLYTYFLSLVDQYTKIINPLPCMLDEIRSTIENNQIGLIKALQIRSFFEKQRVEQKEIEDEANEKDRIAFAQIDWHDFVVVEQVNFKDDDKPSLPHPVNLEKLGERLLAQEHYEAMRREQEEKKQSTVNSIANTQLRDVSINNKSNEIDLDHTTTSTNSPLPQNKDQLIADESDSKKVKRRFEAIDMPTTVSRKAGLTTKEPNNTKNKDKLMVSPITGELIPADSIAEHMKINLLDPRYKEQKERLYLEKKQQDEVFTVGSSMVSHLKELAQRRSDIFGPSTLETQIGKKLEDYQPVNSLKSAVPLVGTTPSLSSQNVNECPVPQGVALNPNRIQPQNVSTSANLALNITNNVSSVPNISTANPPSFPPIVNMPPNSNVITKVPEGLAQFPKYQQMLPGSMFPPSSQPHVYNTHNTPVGLPPPVFNPMNARMPIMNPNTQLRGMQPGNPMINLGNPYGVGVHGLPPPSSTPLDPFAKQTNPIESMLIPESVFLSSNSKHEITLKIKIPQNEDLKNKHGWKLDGQFESVPSNMTWKISQLKAELTKAIGIPASKQKLTIGQGFFMKDANSLAYYNLMDSSFVNLQIKERGGKNR